MMSDELSAPAQLSPALARFIAGQRVAFLATGDAEGNPSVTPICFAFDGARFYTPLDEKPQHVPDSQLRRVRNIQARSAVALLFNTYDDDWSRLGHALVRGNARLLAPADAAHAPALELLRARYPQYRAMALETRPLIAITPTHASGWGPALAAADEAEDEAADASAAQSPWMQPGRGLDFLPLARNRRSVRAFQQRPVPRAALETMIEAARWAPSPHGTQPWRFVVLTREEPKRALAAAMGDDWRRTLAMDREPPEVVEKRLARSRERIERAPALVLACLYLADLDIYPDPDRQRAEETMAVQSLGAALQNLLLAAYSLGLDTGWMCAPLFSPDSVRAALALDAALIPHALIPVGYLAQEPKRRPHRPLDELVVRFD